MNNGFIQFTDESDKVVITNGSLTFIKDGSRNLAFYGSRGRSVLSDVEFETVVQEVGFEVPEVDDTDAPTVATAIPDPLNDLDD